MILDLFAGPGGWSEGLRMLGLSDIGIEWDDAACRTRKAAGHLTIRTDVAAYPTEPFLGKVTGLIASPPCQDFSLAGKRAGIAGDRGQLVWQVLRWADALRPEWIALEQVPEVFPIWQHMAHTFRMWGYNASAVILDAADYGVPQNRERAIVVAHRSRPAIPPISTHGEHGGDSLWGPITPWVTLSDALGLEASLRHVRGAGMIARHGARPDRRPDQPAFTVTSKSRSWVLRTGANSMKHSRTGSKAGEGGVVPYERRIDRPAPTVDCKASHAWKVVDGVAERKLTIAEIARLQTFRDDYPWQGSRSKQAEQIGNAVPPLFAAHVIAAATGLPFLTEGSVHGEAVA